MSIRLGTSSTFSRRAKLRRVRGASREAKTATPQVETCEGRGSRTATATPRAELARDSSATSQDSTGRHAPLGGALGAHGPRPARLPYVAGRARWTAATIGRVQRIVAGASTEAAHPRRTTDRSEARLPQPGDGAPARVCTFLLARTVAARSASPVRPTRRLRARQPVQDRMNDGFAVSRGEVKRGGRRAAPLHLWAICRLRRPRLNLRARNRQYAKSAMDRDLAALADHGTSYRRPSPMSSTADRPAATPAAHRAHEDSPRERTPASDAAALRKDRAVAAC